MDKISIEIKNFALSDIAYTKPETEDDYLLIEKCGDVLPAGFELLKEYEKYDMNEIRYILSVRYKEYKKLVDKCIAYSKTTP